MLKQTSKNVNNNSDSWALPTLLLFSAYLAGTGPFICVSTVFTLEYIAVLLTLLLPVNKECPNFAAVICVNLLKSHEICYTNHIFGVACSGKINLTTNIVTGFNQNTNVVNVKICPIITSTTDIWTKKNGAGLEI